MPLILQAIGAVLAVAMTLRIAWALMLGHPEDLFDQSEETPIEDPT